MGCPAGGVVCKYRNGLWTQVSPEPPSSSTSPRRTHNIASRFGKIERGAPGRDSRLDGTRHKVWVMSSLSRRRVT
jgi:hypothetical protein